MTWKNIRGNSTLDSMVRKGLHNGERALHEQCGVVPEKWKKKTKQKTQGLETGEWVPSPRVLSLSYNWSNVLMAT